MSHYFSSPGDIDGQLIPAPPTCPGDTFTFTCTVSGDIKGFTTWRVDRMEKGDCVLVHRVKNNVTCDHGRNTFKATYGAGFGTDGATSFTSTLSGTATPELNGKLVECFGPESNPDPADLVGNSTIQLVGQCVFAH